MGDAGSNSILCFSINAQTNSGCLLCNASTTPPFDKDETELNRPNERKAKNWTVHATNTRSDEFFRAIWKS